MPADRELSYWPTPPEVADDLVYWLLAPWLVAGGGEGIRVLEPSAGEGHLARAIRHHLPLAHITAVEPSPPRAAVLRALDSVVDEVVEDTLEGFLAQRAGASAPPFDLVVMNPPFRLAGHREVWAEHILAIHHAPCLVAPWGLIGAVVPHIALRGQSRLVRTVRDLVTESGRMKECPRGAFDSVGAQVSTALMCVEMPCPPDEDGLADGRQTEMWSEAEMLVRLTVEG